MADASCWVPVMLVVVPVMLVVVPCSDAGDGAMQ